MNKVSNAEKQRRFVEAKKDAGLRRLVLWARPEDVEDLKLAARQPHSLAKLKKRVEAELVPEIEAKVRDQLKRRTERALLAQARAEARKHPARSNSPPPRVRFTKRPPEAVRSRLRAAGWRYDPVAAVWRTPASEALWDATEALLADLGEWEPLRLAEEPL